MFAVELTNFLMIAVSGETTVSVWRVFRRKKTYSCNIVDSFLLLENFQVFQISPWKSSVVFGHLRQSLDIFGSLRKSMEISRIVRKWPKTP